MQTEPHLALPLLLPSLRRRLHLSLVCQVALQEFLVCLGFRIRLEFQCPPLKFLDCFNSPQPLPPGSRGVRMQGARIPGILCCAPSARFLPKATNCGYDITRTNPPSPEQSITARETKIKDEEIRPVSLSLTVRTIDKLCAHVFPLHCPKISARSDTRCDHEIKDKTRTRTEVGKGDDKERNSVVMLRGIQIGGVDIQ